MRRSLKVVLATTVATGAVLAGAGSAYAAGVFPSHDDHHKVNCARVINNGKAKESDFPSDNHFLAFANATPQDAKDSHGNPYYLHDQFCTGGKDPGAWRNWHDHGDKSYKTFKFSRDPGTNYPSRDPKKNSYVNQHGYDKKLQNPNNNHAYLDRDHIGAPKNPKYATE